jgi:hypothetical protein
MATGRTVATDTANTGEKPVKAKKSSLVATLGEVAAAKKSKKKEISA